MMRIRHRLLLLRDGFLSEGDAKGVAICDALLAEFRDPVGRIIVVCGKVVACDNEIEERIGYSLVGMTPSQYIAPDWRAAALDHIEAGAVSPIAVGILSRKGDPVVLDAHPRHAHSEDGLWIRVVTFYEPLEVI